jgi:hypothetical protein
MLALQVNLRTEIVYIHRIKAWSPTAFTALLDLLRQGRIWAVNLGETDFSQEQWWELVDMLPETAVSFMYISEQHTKYKRGEETIRNMAMNRIRENRMAYGERDLFAMRYLIRMWFNGLRIGGELITSTFARSYAVLGRWPAAVHTQ